MERPHPTTRRPLWKYLLAALGIALASLLSLALIQIVLLGVATRDAASSARRFCDEHPVGSVIDPDALARQLPWLRVTPPRDPGGPARVEAQKGVLLRVFRCTLEVQGAKVTSALYEEER